jgi:hypothetical protein
MTEKQVKAMSIYDFYFRIFTFKKQADKLKSRVTSPKGHDW